MASLTHYGVQIGNAIVRAVYGPLPVLGHADLERRGFRRHPYLTSFYGHCLPCGQHQSIRWWQAPAPSHVQVTACETCGTVPRDDAAFVLQFPEVK